MNFFEWTFRQKRFWIGILPWQALAVWANVGTGRPYQFKTHLVLFLCALIIWFVYNSDKYPKENGSSDSNS